MSRDSYLSRHDFQWESLPESWNSGAFLGNGMIGAMVWFEPETQTLRLEIGRCDIFDKRPREKSVGDALYDKPRLPVGAFHWKPDVPSAVGSMRLSLWNAELTGEIGGETLRIFIPAGLDVIFFESKSGTLAFTPAEAISPRIQYWKKCPDTYVPNVPAQCTPGRCVQNLYAGSSYSTRWERGSGYWQIACGWNNDADQELLRAATRPLLKWRESHRQTWHKRYRHSSLNIPDCKLERFYWRQIYKCYAATRPSGVVLDLLGPWPKVTPWPAIWWNLNVQLTYSPLFTANRMELCRPLLRCLADRFDAFCENVPPEFRHDSAAIGRASGYDCISPVEKEYGNLLWVCHSYYLYYRYSMNRAVLKPLFRLLKRCVNFYLHVLYRGTDKKWHLPPTYSPEFGETADCCYDLALLRRGCLTLQELNRELQCRDESAKIWRDVENHLVSFPEDERGFRVGADLSFDRSHRHYSHLLMIEPLNLKCNPDTARKSVENFLSMPEKAAGYTFTGGAAMKARLGDGDAAATLLHSLLRWMEERGQVNTMYEEAGPVIETPLAFAASLQKMLLQSYGGVIRIFPAIPRDWENVSFENFRAEGAFLVSAERKNGDLQSLAVKSLCGAKTMLQISPDALPFELALKKGETYTYSKQSEA